MIKVVLRSAPPPRSLQCIVVVYQKRVPFMFPTCVSESSRGQSSSRSKSLAPTFPPVDINSTPGFLKKAFSHFSHHAPFTVNFAQKRRHLDVRRRRLLPSQIYELRLVSRRRRGKKHFAKFNFSGIFPKHSY